MATSWDKGRTMDRSSHRSWTMNVEMLRTIFRITCWIPLMWLLSLYSLALATRTQYEELWMVDPKRTDLDVLYYVVGVLLVLNLFGLALWLALNGAFRMDKVPIPPGTKVYLLGLLLTLIQFKLDPFGLLFWYAD